MAKKEEKLDYIDSFIKSHAEYFQRNLTAIKSNTWNVATDYEKKRVELSNRIKVIKEEMDPEDSRSLVNDLEKELRELSKSAKKNKEALFKQEHELTKSILSRLSVFVDNTKKVRQLEKVKNFIDKTAEIISLHVKKCDKYLDYNTNILELVVTTDDEIEYKSSEIVFQDNVFNCRMFIQEKLNSLNINEEINGEDIKFFKDAKAPLLMREPLEILRTDITPIIKSLPVEWSLMTSKEFFINMNPRDIPKWNPNKHFFDQDPVAIQFWQEEINKIRFGLNLGDFFVHPWLYFHLNFFRTPIPQPDGSEPSVVPGLRDNEWFMAENIKAAVSQENENYFSKALLIYGSRRIAKALRDDQVLHYTDGTLRPIGKANVGDEIYGSDGKPTKIIGVYPQGKLDIYKVELLDGRISYCTDDHLWTVYDYQAGCYKVLPLKELKKRYTYTRDRVRNGKNVVSQMYNYYLPINQPVEYSKKDLPLDPYFFGLWIGDGLERGVSITTIDQEVKDWLKEFANKEGVNYWEQPNVKTKAINAILVKNTGKYNPILDKLKSLDLIENKHIPEIYLKSSIEDRMELLRGIMDTDGTINESGGGIKIALANKVLSEGVLELCRSLGIACKYDYSKGNYIKKCGNLNDVYTVTMYTNKPVFKLQRKLDRIDKNPIPARLSKMERVAIINIEKVGYDNATCIRVDNESKEFLTNDFIVTHNSVMMASIAHWKTITKFNSAGSIVGGTKSDLDSLTSKIKTSMSFIEKPLRLDILKQEWESGETTFGIKEDASNPIVFSSLIVQNLEGGAKSSSQKTAGLAPSVSIYDEIGKYPFLKPYKAALPSFKTPYGFKCLTVLSGTGGEASLSMDAVSVLSNPEAFDLLPMNWDILENHIDPEHVTWKRRRFATFYPGQMAYEEGFHKIPQKLSDFVGVDNPELKKIEIQVTNWENNSKVLLQKIEEAKNVGGSKGNLMEQQQRVFYPIDPEDCFMSAEKNPFPALEAKRHKEYLIQSGEVGKKVVLTQDKNGRISYELSNKQLAEYPFQGGFIDSPVVLYEELPQTKPVDYLYVAGFDDYKQEESGTDSVGSFHIYKVDIGMDKWCGRIVASYASRPDPHGTLHRQAFLLMQAFNAKCFMENEDMSFKDYLDKKRMTDFWLVESMDFKTDMTENSKGRRRYGWAPTTENKSFLLRQAVHKANQEYHILDEDGTEKTVLGVQLINDIGLLDEMINYKKENNVDRITSYMSCLGYEFYLFNNYMLPTVKSFKDRKEDNQRKKIETKTIAERLYGKQNRPMKLY